MAKKALVKGTYKYIRFGLTLQRFRNFLKRAGTAEVGIAQDDQQCPIARFVIEALGAERASIGSGNTARSSRAGNGYDADTLVKLPDRKWATRFIKIVDEIFDAQAVTGSQALRVLRLALDRNVDSADVLDWQRDYAKSGSGPVARARARAKA
jgi:hypothetical protein